jgi:hypothetical protein
MIYCASMILSTESKHEVLWEMEQLRPNDSRSDWWAELKLLAFLRPTHCTVQWIKKQVHLNNLRVWNKMTVDCKMKYYSLHEDLELLCITYPLPPISGICYVPNIKQPSPWLTKISLYANFTNTQFQKVPICHLICAMKQKFCLMLY